MDRMDFKHHRRSICVTVTYVEKLSIEDCVREICLLSSPQVLLWYIGTDGLKKNCADYYKNFLISPVLNNSKNATFWLIDLTAWNSLKNPKATITKTSSLSQKIEDFQLAQIKCIKSADILMKIQNIKEEILINYFRKTLHRDFISLPSKNTHKTNITVRSIFNNNCPILEDWYDFDAAKAYSTLQYLEGCLLIEDIVQKNADKPEIEIVFALPNDEIKYYKDATQAFQEDVEFLLNHHLLSASIEINVFVKFITFTYGDSEVHRPYNAPGKTFKKNDFTCNNVVGPELQDLENRRQ